MTHPLGKRLRKVPYKSEKGPQTAAPNSDINVTPLVDVCLVLLIIFMVVTPMLGRGKDVRLPALVEAREWPEGDQVFVSVDEVGAWVGVEQFNERAGFMARLTEELKVAQGKAAASGYDGPILFIKGDREASWGYVSTVVQWIKEAELGVDNVALVVDLAEGPGSA